MKISEVSETQFLQDFSFSEIQIGVTGETRTKIKLQWLNAASCWGKVIMEQGSTAWWHVMLPVLR